MAEEEFQFDEHGDASVSDDIYSQVKSLYHASRTGFPVPFWPIPPFSSILGCRYTDEECKPEGVVMLNHIEVSGDWTAEEFANVMIAYNNAYREVLEKCVRTHAYFLYRDGIGHDDKERYYMALEVYKHLGVIPLRVKRIHYSSPGAIDFAGLGAAFGHLKDLILAYVPTREQAHKNRLAELERVERTVDLLKKIGFTDDELRTMVVNSEVSLRSLLESGKISSIDVKALNE